MSNLQNQPQRDSGSFRDPSGYVFMLGDTVIRTVNPSAAEAFKAVRQSQVIEQLTQQGLMIDTEVNPILDVSVQNFSGARGEVPTFLLKHPKVDFISYPYEWTFTQLKDAALTHLKIQLLAFERGMILSDATPFNMQFMDGKPVHIDVLSLKPYVQGEPWSAYNQFCRLFLLPLLIEAWVGMPFQGFLKASLDGVEFADAIKILPKRKLYLSLNGLIHVLLQAKAVDKTSSSQASEAQQKKISLNPSRYKAILLEMQAWISGLQSGRNVKSYWNEYAHVNSYQEGMRFIKERFVSQWAVGLPNGTLWDIGGNTGDYSMQAIQAGMKNAVIFDGDIDSLEKAYQRAKTQKKPLLPVLMDLADPSPAMGWNQSERKGLNERQKPDGILALAVIHHLVIGRNLPHESVIAWFVHMASKGIIEFVPKSDPMVRQMLSHREDIFVDYDEAHFRKYLSQFARIVQEERIPENDRVIFSYERV
jgi:hypothetical protein